MAAATVPKPRVFRNSQTQLPFSPEERFQWSAKPSKLNRFDRSPDSPAEKERSGKLVTEWRTSDPATWKGKTYEVFGAFTPVPDDVFADVGRLTKGCQPLLMILMYGMRQTFGIGPGKRGGSMPTETPKMRIHELANIIGYEFKNQDKEESAKELEAAERSIWGHLREAESRPDQLGKPAPLIKVYKHRPGEISYTLLYENWERALSYEDARDLKKQPQSADEIHADAAADEATAKKTGETVHLNHGKPVRFRARTASKPVPITAGVNAYRVEDKSPTGVIGEFSLDGFIVGGELRLTLCCENLRLNPNGLAAAARNIIRKPVEAIPIEAPAAKSPPGGTNGHSPGNRSNKTHHLGGDDRNIIRKPPAAWKQDPNFLEFHNAYLTTGAAVIDEDFAEAYQYVWKNLSLPAKMERMKALVEHIPAWDEPRFIPKPRKFLEKEWQRRVVMPGKKKPSHEQTARALEALNRLEAQHARRK